MRGRKRKAVKLIMGCAALALPLWMGCTEIYAADYDAHGNVLINEINFPDPVFRALIASSDYDRDGNGVLDANEIYYTRNVYCESMGIKSIQGIEFFTYVEGLWCRDNEIETMDISNNKELHGVWCSENKFTYLDFTPNPKLEWVYCYDCNLSTLIVENNEDLAFLECNTNPLTHLNVRQNHALEHLTCGTCELTELDVSQNPNLAHLDAFSNHLTELNVDVNTKLKRLDIWNNPGLKSINVRNNHELQYYNCAYNEATEIDVSQNPELQKLICSYNEIEALDLYNNPKLVYLDCAKNLIDKLDLSRNTEVYFLQAFTNDFTTLNIGNNRFLIKTYQEGEKKAEYDVCRGHSWTIDYGGETSTGGDNICFLCIDDVVTVTMDPVDAEGNQGWNGNSLIDYSYDHRDLVTREMVVQTLYEMAGEPSVAGLKSRFKDVKPGAWYEDALLWGEKNSICVGSPDVSSDNFGIGEFVEVQDLALMLMRYAEYMDYKRSIDFGRSDDFADYFEIDYYAWEAICWAASYDIIVGKGDPGAPKSERRIEPHGKVTRAEFNAMYDRMMEVNAKPNKVEGTTYGLLGRLGFRGFGPRMIMILKVVAGMLRNR